MVKTFAVIGVMTIFGVLIFFTFLASEAIGSWIREAQRRYKIEHRFDEPPTAKCYCRDCSRWNAETGECSDYHTSNGYSMADNWFCYSAEPLSAAGMKERDKAVKEKSR